ncbi:MAG: aminopeptidase [bacterium]
MTMRTIVAAAMTLGFSGALAPAQAPDKETLAQNIVTKVANVKEGDGVLIAGNPRDLELLEDLAVNVRKAGGFPIVMIQTDRMAKRLFEDVPEKYDSQSPDLALKLASTIPVRIDVESRDDLALFAGTSPARQAARAKAEAPVGTEELKHNVRRVFLGNELYPTPDRAKQYAMTQDQLSKIFWDGVNVDTAKLAETASAIKAKVAAGKQLTFTAPNGTDIKMQIAGRPAHASDGAISDEDLAAGGASCQAWLPAGEVYVTPVPGTASGTVVIDRVLWNGKDVTGVKLKFKNGKLTSMTAKSGLDLMKARYDAAGTGKELFGAVDIGINPAVTVPAASRLATWVAAGTVSLGFGDNQWAGGENASDFAVYGQVMGGTLKVDGTVIVEKGALK